MEIQNEMCQKRKKERKKQTHAGRWGDFPGGSVVKTLCSHAGLWVQSLVRKLDSACHN